MFVVMRCSKVCFGGDPFGDTGGGDCIGWKALYKESIRWRRSALMSLGGGDGGVSDEALAEFLGTGGSVGVSICTGEEDGGGGGGCGGGVTEGSMNEDLDVFRRKKDCTRDPREDLGKGGGTRRGSSA